MVRNIPVGVNFDYTEWKELEERAEEKHLPLATYIRFYLFNAGSNFSAHPIEPVRNGIPKRLVSSQIVHAIKRTDKMGEVLREMEKVFNEGLKLIPVTEEMKMQVFKNRELPEFNPEEMTLKELHPPK